jgi:hypothetical protein
MRVRSRAAWLGVAGGSGLLGALLAVALLRGLAPAREEPDGGESAGARQGTGPGESAEASAKAGPGGSEGVAETSGEESARRAGSGAVEVARFSVCEREETRAALAELPLVGGRAPLLALHCGRSLHLIAVEPHGGALVPERVAVVQTATGSPAETAVALEPSAADVNGDGRADLIAPVAFVDSTGVPRGGGVYALHQRAAGGFDAPLRLLAAAPGQVVSAQVDDQPAADLAVLQRSDASTGRADELWLMTGGPSPLRIAQRPVGVRTRAIAALDLDRDGRDDLAAASSDEGRILLLLSSVGALAQSKPTELRLAGVEQLLAADTDRDGTRELLLVGERCFRLSLPEGGQPSAVAIDGSEGLRDVHLADTDADGQLELVGYAHPDVIALRPVGEQRVERTRVLTLRGEAPVLFARLTQLDADPRPDLVVIVLATGTGREVEVALARNLGPAAVVQLGAGVTPVGEAALLQRFTLP